jgi:hypothetical protein
MAALEINLPSHPDKTAKRTVKHAPTIRVTIQLSN